MKDYLIVGQGIAGSLVAYELHKSGAEVEIIDHPYDSSSSKVAAGLFNPVTGKRKVKTWLADTLFPYLVQYYTQLEKDLGAQFLNKRNIYKPYNDIADQNDLISKSTSDHLGSYLNPDYTGKDYDNVINNEFGGIEVIQSGNIRTKAMLKAFADFFNKHGLLSEESFVHTELEVNPESIVYHGKEYKNIIFCEGYKCIWNPLFEWLPFAVTKGQILTVRIPSFPNERIVNKGFFILPKENDVFLIGSSYDHTTEEGPTKKGREQVLAKINDLVTCDYEVLEENAAIRPTVKDRRPFIGTHPEHSNVHIFNGLGTKGISLGPYFCEQFKKYLLTNEKLDDSVNIERYFSLF